jgi:hypothetical protein
MRIFVLPESGTHAADVIVREKSATMFVLSLKKSKKLDLMQISLKIYHI